MARELQAEPVLAALVPTYTSPLPYGTQTCDQLTKGWCCSWTTRCSVCVVGANPWKIRDPWPGTSSRSAPHTALRLAGRPRSYPSRHPRGNSIPTTSRPGCAPERVGLRLAEKAQAHRRRVGNVDMRRASASAGACARAVHATCCSRALRGAMAVSARLPSQPPREQTDATFAINAVFSRNAAWEGVKA